MKKLGLRSCDTNMGGLNKWFIDESYFNDYAVPPRVKTEYTEL